MKLQRSIYIDDNGNEWIIERQSIPNLLKRGAYTYWIAECNSLQKAFREPLKRELIKEIKNFLNQLKNHKNQNNGTPTKQTQW